MFITKTYKRAPPKLQAASDLEAKYIANKLALINRTERLAKTPAYIKVKNHTENFHAATPCRLINCCKSEINT